MPRSGITSTIGICKLLEISAVMKQLIILPWKLQVAQSEPRHPFAFLRQDNSGVTDNTPLPSSRASGASIDRIVCLELSILWAS